MQPRVILFETREIQLGQLGWLNLPVLDELGQMGHRKKRQIVIGGRPRNLEFPTLQWSAIAWESFPRRNGIEDKSWLGIIGKIGNLQRVERRDRATRTVQVFDDSFPFLSCEG